MLVPLIVWVVIIQRDVFRGLVQMDSRYVDVGHPTADEWEGGDGLARGVMVGLVVDY